MNTSTSNNNNTQFDKMFTPLTVGNITIPNRFIMAPLTRVRATEQHVPTPMMEKYYTDRASAGLIIAEATQIDAQHSTFYTEPGIFNEEQIAGWKRITEAVHAKGGLIYLQIHHGGRAAHSLNDGAQPVAPSAIPIEGHGVSADFVRGGQRVPYDTPRVLRDDEIPDVIARFVAAARNAITAGFDGVEVHGANGYLLDQFWKESSNQREGPYGGSIANRSRLTFEVVEAVARAIGSHRTAVRLSPLNSYNSQSDSNPEALTTHLVERLATLDLAYLHIMRADFYGVQKGDPLTWARKVYKGIIVSNMGYTAEEAEQQIRDGLVDAVAFGTKFIANPDFVERTRAGVELNKPDPTTFYKRTEVGYNDYPFWTDNKQHESNLQQQQHESAVPAV